MNYNLQENDIDFSIIFDSIYFLGINYQFDDNEIVQSSIYRIVILYLHNEIARF